MTRRSWRTKRIVRGLTMVFAVASLVVSVAAMVLAALVMLR